MPADISKDIMGFSSGGEMLVMIPAPKTGNICPQIHSLVAKGNRDIRLMTERINIYISAIV